MKATIHPVYTPDAKITCACGASYTVGSTVASVAVELCAKCHPFYTGKQKLVDSARRVEKFVERNKKAVTRVKKPKAEPAPAAPEPAPDVQS